MGTDKPAWETNFKGIIEEEVRNGGLMGRLVKTEDVINIYEGKFLTKAFLNSKRKLPV